MLRDSNKVRLTAVCSFFWGSITAGAVFFSLIIDEIDNVIFELCCNGRRVANRVINW